MATTPDPEVMPRWWKLYRFIEDLAVGQYLLFDAAEELGFDIRRSRTLFYRARKELELQHSRTMVSVEGKGYKVVAGLDHLNQAKRHVVKGNRQYRRARHLSTTTDEELLDREMREWKHEFEERAERVRLLHERILRKSRATL